MLKRKIYLTGAALWRPLKQLDLFQHAIDILTAQGHEVTSAIDDLKDIDRLNEPAFLNEYITARKEKMKAAEVVLFLEGYQYEVYCTHELQEATRLKKEVSSINEFLTGKKSVESIMCHNDSYVWRHAIDGHLFTCETFEELESHIRKTKSIVLPDFSRMRAELEANKSFSYGSHMYSVTVINSVS